jgi:hypothetical protein
MTTKSPLQVGDRIWVENINIGLGDALELVDAVVMVQRVDPQWCGCWRITCDRAGYHAPAGFSTIALYGADCSWPHEDRIDYEAARAAAEGALFLLPSAPRQAPAPVLAQERPPRVRTLVATGGVL